MKSGPLRCLPKFHPATILPRPERPEPRERKVNPAGVLRTVDQISMAKEKLARSCSVGRVAPIVYQILDFTIPCSFTKMSTIAWSK